MKMTEVDTLPNVQEMLDAQNPFFHFAPLPFAPAGTWRIAYCGERFQSRGIRFYSDGPLPDGGPWCPDCLRLSGR